jgi:predicted DNA binding protein
VSQEFELARPTLDTLPLNVAVIDDGGEILLTNRAWDQFATEQDAPGRPGSVGENYLAAVERGDDEFARRAGDGIEAVLRGDRDRFTLEYPCHTPERRRWFLMRVSPLPLDGDRGAVVAHLEITGRKEAELAADERADQLEHVLDRVNGLVGDVSAAVVHARGRSEAEAVACEQFVETAPYRFAWVGRPDLRSDRLVPHEWAGDPPSSFRERTLSTDVEDPTVEAYRTGEVRMVDDLSRIETDWDPAEQWDAVAMAAIPLTYRSKTYGVLTAYADETEVFDERERAVLSALGRTVATAVHALTSGRVLSAASVIEVELSLGEAVDPLARLARATGGTVDCRDSMVDDEGRVRLYATVDGPSAETVQERLAADEAVSSVDVLTEGADRVLVETRVTETVIADVADHDGLTEELTATDDGLTVTAAFPDEESARAAFERLQDRHGSVSLASYRERDRRSDTAAGFTRTVESALTDRQLTALRTAYFSGYFEWPRPVSGDEVAESMDITRATFHQHLREAQRKLAAAFFESAELE